MFKKFTLTTKLLFIAAILSLIYSEFLIFNGNSEKIIFIGLWVPSIIGFGICLNLINHKKDDLLHTIFCRVNNLIIWHIR